VTFARILATPLKGARKRAAGLKSITTSWNGTVAQTQPITSTCGARKKRITLNMPLWLAMLNENIHLVVDEIKQVAKLSTSRRR
jgi:hypothetical protein